jgi:hypothetical protein
MPDLSPAEYEALKASIAAGYDPAHQIVVDENGAVLDGHHREQACDELGITPPRVVLPGLTEDQKHDYALRANLACRHLTRQQKRDLIRAELDRIADRSDREIGRLCGVDHKTVGVVRRGEFPHWLAEAQATFAVGEGRHADRVMRLLGLADMRLWPLARRQLDSLVLHEPYSGGPPWEDEITVAAAIARHVSPDLVGLAASYLVGEICARLDERSGPGTGVAVLSAESEEERNRLLEALPGGERW